MPTQTSNDLDMMPRYAPDRVIIAQAMKLLPVLSYVFHPAGSHASSPIKNEMGALELITAKGSRWYGCERAYINSELRMVVIGTPRRDEVRMKWEVCSI
jgi:hypothetical protein